MGYYLENIKFKFTDDNSAGLYDLNVQDIFHSKTGALSEAYDKFINPVLSSGKAFEDNISVLDICYGIGYNSKAALDSFKNNSINIDALEFNKELIYISPFIKDNIKNKYINYILLDYITEKITDFDLFIQIIEYMNKNISSEFFNDLYDDLTNFISNKGYKYVSEHDISEFLHNIYYNYISNSMLYDSKLNNNKKRYINFYTGDARKSIKLTDNKYDVVFLDGFSPKKDPSLWTIDFLSVVKSKMKNDSVLVSYSKSVPFRSALLELGLIVGKTLINNEDMGTICSLNSNYIKNPLNDTDYKIISSRSGIPYRDSTLSLTPVEILNNRNIEAITSGRISRTQLNKHLNL